MKGNDVGAGFGKVRDNAINRFNHQMHIDDATHAGGCFAYGFANQWAYGQVRHVVIVHHIKMH